MSKQSRKKARKRKMKHKSQAWMILCPSCGREDDGSVGSLLMGVADALNACSDSGLKLALRHGAVLAAGKLGGGFVLPLRDGRWTARDQHYDRYEQVPSLLEDED